VCKGDKGVQRRDAVGVEVQVTMNVKGRIECIDQGID